MGPKPNETKAEKFERVFTQRVEYVITNIRKLGGNLTNQSQYEILYPIIEKEFKRIGKALNETRELYKKAKIRKK